jgi:hypothetical protein
MTNFNSSGFQGIVMALNGDAAEEQLPPDPETDAVSSSCGAEHGKFSIHHAGLRAWFYAEGGDVSSPGITLGPGTEADFLPSGKWKLLDLLLEDVTPTQFDLQGWRECYKLLPAEECST